MNAFSSLVLVVSCAAGIAFAKPTPPPHEIAPHDMPTMDPKMKEAIDACHTELKMDHSKHKSISPKQKKMMDDCLKGKGIDNPPPIPPHHPGMEKKAPKGPRPPKGPTDSAPGVNSPSTPEEPTK